MKQLYILSLGILFLACKNENKAEAPVVQKEEIPVELIQENAENGKKWLEKSIDGHFSNDNPPMIMMTTPDYYEFKIDALNADLGLPGSITKDEFTAKWKDKFDLSREDVYDGFLIPAQDFGKIKVGSVEFEKNLSDTLVYNVLINDEQFGVSYQSIIHLIPIEKGFQIADQFNKR